MNEVNFGKGANLSLVLSGSWFQTILTIFLSRFCKLARENGLSPFSSLLLAAALAATLPPGLVCRDETWFGSLLWPLALLLFGALVAARLAVNLAEYEGKIDGDTDCSAADTHEDGLIRDRGELKSFLLFRDG